MLSVLAKLRGLLLFPAFFTVYSSVAQVVKTDRGYVKGITENGIQVFKGVPYAAPPTGALRFMPPVTHANWKDTLSAANFGPEATQGGNGQVSGSEDCLSLNIYTPATDHNKRAVVVWVHGGAMIGGSGKGMDGHAFADKDNIITVTINYRLGSFGFLYLGDVDKRYVRSGNNGLLDVVQALKWIHANIAAFGGDPGRVTIMGESAGAKLISAVLVSPLSKGLFRQVIAESGSVQCIRDTVTAKNERALLLKQLGLQPNDARKLLTLPAETIIKAQEKVCAGIGGISFFGPVYDGAVIPQDAYSYASGNMLPRIKALIGTNESEAAAFVGQDVDLKNAYATIFEPQFKADAPMVYAYYQTLLKTEKPYAALIKALTQYMYQLHSYRFAAVLSGNKIPVWMYRFKYNNGDPFGARHGNELHYIWGASKILSSNDDAAKKQLATNLHGAWVSFIKTGNPNISTLPAWPVYNTAARQIMIFDTTNTVVGLKTVYNDKKLPSAIFVIK